MASTNLNLFKRNEESINNYSKKLISSMIVAGSLNLGVNANAQSNEVLMSSINNLHLSIGFTVVTYFFFFL